MSLYVGLPLFFQSRQMLKLILMRLKKKLEQELDLIIDFGIIESQETTVISCIDNDIEITRQGIGIASMLD